jgi:hypothetical protein
MRLHFGAKRTPLMELKFFRYQNMSLHISYELRVPTALKLPEVQRFVGDMHEEARRLLFHTVSPIFHATAEQCRYANWRSLPDELQWMVVQNARLVAEPFCPAELVGFITLPADGAEWAAFGFCRFERGDRGQNLAPICKQVLDNGWHWSAWCSTLRIVDHRSHSFEPFGQKNRLGKLHHARVLVKIGRHLGSRIKGELL